MCVCVCVCVCACVCVSADCVDKAAGGKKMERDGSSSGEEEIREIKEESRRRGQREMTLMMMRWRKAWTGRKGR